MKTSFVLLSIPVLVATTSVASARLCAFKPVCVGCEVTHVQHTFACAAAATACAPAKVQEPTEPIVVGPAVLPTPAPVVEAPKPEAPKPAGPSVVKP